MEFIKQENARRIEAEKLRIKIQEEKD
jgi:hypothetical protein